MLRSLPDEDAKKLLKASKVNTYARRENLVSEGDKSDTFHIVLDGRVAVRVTRPTGDTAIVNILGPDSHFGEVSLLTQEQSRRTASVVALEPVRTLSIPASVFHDLRERNPRLEALVSRLLASARRRAVRPAARSHVRHARTARRAAARRPHGHLRHRAPRRRPSR